MKEPLRRAMVVQTSRVRFLEAWARRLSTRDSEEVKHAVQVFAQARFQVSKPTARKYARKVLELLGITESSDDHQSVHSLKQYMR